jgi:hypothetical protein
MMHRGHCPEAQRLYDKARDTIAAIKRAAPEPREAIICEECGRALNGVVELVDHYLLRHQHEEAAWRVFARYNGRAPHRANGRGPDPNLYERNE